MSSRTSFYSLLFLVCALAYVGGFGAEYLLDPLGRAPVLDGAENLAWAQVIATGELPAEPFYRALLYPWVLSLFGLDAATLVPVASLLGVLCHLLNVLLVGQLSKCLWGRSSAGWFASMIYVIYPVALYFSVQVLDITFGITLFLASIYAVLRACRAHGTVLRLALLIIAGLLGGVCVLARPNFLLPLLVFPFVPALLYCGQAQIRLRAMLEGLLLLLALSLPLLGQGLLNYRLSGSFRVLPWQGAYNLYAANDATANGKYFTQSVSFDEIPAGMNPTRMESEYLYLRAEGGDLKGEDAPLEIDAMNAYWRAQFWEEITTNPWRWLGLMGRKSVYVVNDWEQYNNLTYAYHKARFSFLRWNPLGWGVLCLGGVFCGVLGYSKARRGVFISLGLLGLAYAAGVLLFFASARFRLPLVPLLAALCGGWAVLPWHEWYRSRQRALMLVGGGCLLGAVCVYGNFFDARNDASFIQDELLLASASAKLGEDAQALRYAEAVLGRDPARAEAKRLQVASLFNMWMSGDSQDRSLLWPPLGVALAELKQHDASTLFIAGVYAWELGDHAAAATAWREALQRFDEGADSSAKALQAVGVAEYFDPHDVGVEQLKKLLNP